MASAIKADESDLDLGNHLTSVLSASELAGRWDWDIPNKRLYVDQCFATLYGIDPEAAAAGLPTSAFYARIHPDDRTRIRIATGGMLEGAEVFFKEYRIVSADGLTRWVQARGQTRLDADDTPVRFSGILIDVTDRKQAEERLRIAQSAGGIGTFEHVGGYGTATVSEQFCRLLGLHASTVLPISTINRLVLPDYPPLIDRGATTLLGDSPYIEIPIARADTGECRWIARRGEYVPDAETTGLRHVGVIYDVTGVKNTEAQLRELNENLEARVEEEVRDRRQAEEALRHSQKLEAVGQLTGGIAHDFNNLLTIIIGNVDTAIRRLADNADPRISRSLEHAQLGAQRAAVLTQRLLAFSRRQPLSPKPTHIGRLLAGVSELLDRTLGERVQIETFVPPDLWMVEVDAHQLENALVNLAVNARDAMPNGGKVTITATNSAMNLISPGSGAEIPPSDFVEITVADTGVGMPEEVISKAFDPFFTTKDVGKGTGLGLSMVYGFLKQSGGHVKILSELGSGTTIKLFLPRLNFSDEGPQIVAQRSASRGSETILLVEDDEDVRAFTSESLQELGYRVIEASDGPSALLALSDEPSEIHLLVTDVVMPGVSGRELADQIRRVRPGTRVLFISGYPRDAIVRDGRIDPDVDLLSKPFTYVVLSAKVREMLDAKSVPRSMVRT